MVEGYYPDNFEQALKIVNEKDDVIIYSGGTDLMVRNKNIAALLPKFDKDLLYIGNLKELKEINDLSSTIEIGAACTLSSLLIEKKVPKILKDAISLIASPAIRNMGTIGGNICNASPAGDTLPILYALNTKLKLTNENGSRQVNIEDFILGPRKISLDKNEILQSIIIPKMGFNKTKYEKVGARKASAISKLSFVGLAQIENEEIKDLRITLGSVGPTVVRMNDIEEILIGKKLKNLESTREKVSRLCLDKITPIDDQRSTAVYRKKTAIRLIQYFIYNME